MSVFDGLVRFIGGAKERTVKENEEKMIADFIEEEKVHLDESDEQKLVK